METIWLKNDVPFVQIFPVGLHGRPAPYSIVFGEKGHCLVIGGNLLRGTLTSRHSARLAKKSFKSSILQVR